VMPRSDDGPEMSALRFLDDEAIEALTLGDDVVLELAPLAVFADRVRAVGEEPAPRPSLELQSLFASQAATKANRSVRAMRPAGWGPVVRPRRAQERLAGVAGRVAGLGIAAKLALGVSVATAGVAGAGVAGALPDGATQAVQHAIEAVTPLDLGDNDEADRTTRSTSTTSGQRGDGRPEGSGTTGSTGTSSTGTGADAGTVGEQAPDAAPGSGLVPGESGAENSETEEEPNGQGRYRGERWDGDGVLTPEGQGPTTTTTVTTEDETTPASAPGQDPDAAGDEGTEPRQAWDADAAGSTG
jgi:hypothetical protein